MSDPAPTPSDIQDRFAARLRNAKFLEAAKAGEVEAMKNLVAGGVDIDARDDEGRTALQHAAGALRYDAVKWLLENGAAPDLADKNGETPLLWLCSNLEREGPDFGILRLLVGNGAPVNAANKRGETAFIRAAGRCFDTEPLKFLIARGARVDAVETQSHFSALTAAAIEGRAATVEMLLDMGQNVNQRDAWGRSLILHAASANRVETVEILLSRHADVFAKADDGYTPRAEAIRCGYTAMAERMKLAEQEQQDRLFRDGIPGGVKFSKPLRFVPR